jgi:aldehyde:ferredoxin oxidoreductase
MGNEQFGKILKVDLQQNSFHEITIYQDIVKKYLGGPGFAIDHLMKSKVYEYEPLSNNNSLIFMTGVLTSTSFPCSGFYSVSARSPLTNIYGEGLSGGFFGAELRKTLNGIIIEDKADSPVYLKIEDDHYELKDASNIWGLTTDKAMQQLRSELGKQYKISCIGISGEKMIPLASIINDHFRAVGRTGLGAVMGSKNLKAIAVKSTKKLDYYNEKKFNEISKSIFLSFSKSAMGDVLKNFGTNNIDYFERLADVPHKNWTLHKWKGVNEISGSVVFERLHVRNRPCYLCPFSCGREIEIKEGPYKLNNAACSEYETTAAFGSMCLISDVEAIAYLNHICNIMGVDTISAGSTIAFAMDCYEQDILTQEEIGFPLEWGDADAAIRLLNLMCKNEGIGKILSKGSRRASELIGKGSEEFLTTIKGLEAPMHDPRAIFPLGLQYATSNRGACHLRGFANDLYSGFTGFNEALKISKEKSIRERTEDNPKFARDVAISQNLSEINNALGICRQAISSGSQIVTNLLELILDEIFYLTGIKLSLKELMEIGERIFNLKRLFNNKCGITKKDDRIPPRLSFPLEKGRIKDKVLTIDLMLEEYYKLRGWNEEGIPTKSKLVELKIEEY